MKTFQLEGRIQISYASEGEPGERPLLMLHGFTGHRDDFSGVRNALAATRRVICPDLRGHGDSERAAGEGGYTFSACVTDLEALLDGLEIDRCHLLGHSMGGMIALRFALAHSRRVQSLILMSTTPGTLTETMIRDLRKGAAFLEKSDLVAMQRIMEIVARENPDPILANWSDRYWPHQRRRYAAMDPLAYAEFARAMIEQDSLEDRLGAIRCPTLVLVGAEDTDFIPGADLARAGIPHARFERLEGAGHHPHEESREEFLRAMERHLADLD